MLFFLSQRIERLRDAVNQAAGVILVHAKRECAKNYEPNSYDGPAQTNEPAYAPLEIHGLMGNHPWVQHAEDDDFVQAGNLYRLMKEDEKHRLVANIAAGLARVSREGIIERSIAFFRKADPDYGARVT